MKKFMQRKNIVIKSLTIGALILINGCGSSGKSVKQVTGQFIDTYVSGLNYQCSSGFTSTTNELGEYTCNEGDTVTFLLGSYIIGSASASSGIITPATLYPNNKEAELNVAQLLQSIDTGINAEILTIPDNFTALNDVNTSPLEENFDEVIEENLDIFLVSEEIAQAHLNEQLNPTETAVTEEPEVPQDTEVTAGPEETTSTPSALESAIVGKTKYFVNTDGIIGQRTYALDGTYTGTIDGQSAVSGTYIVSADTLIISRTSPSRSTLTLSLQSNHEGLLTFLITIDGGTPFRTYNFSSASQRDDLFPHINLENALVGTTKYFLNTKGGTGNRTYFSDGTYSGTVTGIGAVSGTYQINSGVLSIARMTPTNATLELTFLHSSDGVYSFDIAVNGGTTFQTYSYATAAQRDAAIPASDLATLIRGETKYFLNSKGGTGNRTYNSDGTYTGTVVGIGSVSGTYTITENVLTIMRNGGTTLALTYVGEATGILQFSISVNGGVPFDTYSYATATERDAAIP